MTIVFGPMERKTLPKQRTPVFDEGEKDRIARGSLANGRCISLKYSGAPCVASAAEGSSMCNACDIRWSRQRVEEIVGGSYFKAKNEPKKKTVKRYRPRKPRGSQEEN